MDFDVDKWCEDNSFVYPPLDPINNPIHALRLRVGDSDQSWFILPDATYQMVIDRYPENERKQIREMAMMVLANLSLSSYRQRVGQEDAYLGERFRNYQDFLNKLVTDPRYSGLVPALHIGGVNRERVARLENDPEYIDSTFYLGQVVRKPSYRNYRRLERCTVVEPEEIKRPYYRDE